ncbi:Synaptic vesicle protein EHS-1 and related EH domain proteins [Phaffia rhodozyma]|uniref:Synaptic vesicle protein EHS-1 and related EH domain proteins n=1 Tax=Phaffia rhodozyma TaxID=264483 RepID=A0A0F7SVZ7_PHARH|nr:Synaptic vesicle protein EHS-1 and related EH domain proteins [Phaffia rhodozyma]
MGSIKNRIAAFESNQPAAQATPSSSLPSSPAPTSSQPNISLQALTQGSVQAAARHRASSTGSFASSNATALQPGADIFGKSNDRPTDSLNGREKPSPIKRTTSATSSNPQDNASDRSRSPVKMTLNGQQVGARLSTKSSPRLGPSEVLSLYSADQLSPLAQRFNLPASPSGSSIPLPSKSSPETSKSSVPLPVSGISRPKPPALAPKPVNLKSATSTITRPSVQVERVTSESFISRAVQPPLVARPVVKDSPPSLPDRKPSLPPRSSTTDSFKEPPTAELQSIKLRDEQPTFRPVPSSYRKPPPPIQSPVSSPSSVRSVISNLSQPPPLPARKPTLPTALPLKPSESVSTSSTSTSSSVSRRAPPPPPLPLSSSPKQDSSQSGALPSILSSPCSSPDKTQRGPRATYYKSSTPFSTTDMSVPSSKEERGREEVSKERYNKLFTKLIALQKVGKMRAQLERRNSEQQGWRRPEVVNTDQKTEDEKLAEREREGRLVGAVVKGIWEKSRLEKETLQRIWESTDLNKQGSLNRQEFIIGMSLIDSELGRRRSSQMTGGMIRRDRRAL